MIEIPIFVFIILIILSSTLLISLAILTICYIRYCAIKNIMITKEIEEKYGTHIEEK